MRRTEIQEAIQKEREEIAEIVQSWGFDWWSWQESEAAMMPIANEIRRRTCEERGHTRGIHETNQIFGRERCRHCGDEIEIKAFNGSPQ